MQNKTDYFDNGKSRLYVGNCIDVMKRLIDEGVQIDSIVTDPPYHLTSIVKRFGKEGSAPAQFGTDGAYARASKGFMGKEWDGGDVAFRAETWVLALELLKPGGHLLAFSGSRTYHRMACGIEDAGFEIRDQIMWLYGSGFPKSHNQKGDWQGWGSALKPAHEPIVVARKPLAGTIAENVLQYGTGALNIDGCRIPENDKKTPETRAYSKGKFGGTEGRGVECMIYTPVTIVSGRWPANVIHDGSPETTDPFPADGGASAARFFYCAKASKEDRDEGLGWVYWLDSLELIFEIDSSELILREDLLWVLEGQNLQRPEDGEVTLQKGIFADTILQVDARDLNIALSGNSITALFPRAIRFTTSTGLKTTIELKTLSFYQSLTTSESIQDVIKTMGVSGISLAENVGLQNVLKAIFTKEETGSPLGVKIAPKKTQRSIGAKDALLRMRNIHPTLKPCDLMRYLCRLVTPPGGLVLDPFMGSGSTGKAAMLEGFRFVGIDMTPEYVEIARARIQHAHDQKHDIESLIRSESAHTDQMSLFD